MAMYSYYTALVKNKKDLGTVFYWLKILYKINNHSIILEMYDFPPYRPPSEARSALLRVTRGCPWNHCTFCGMYKSKRYEARPYAEIESDIGEIRDIFPAARTLFIGDSDSLLHDDILKIIKKAKRTFAGLTRITAYARSLTLVRKSDEELSALKEAGLTRLHVGLESGDRSLLKQICKGATPEVMVKGGQKARQAGLELCFYVLCGIGGERGWKQHADGTAGVINQVNPDFIRLRTISLVTNAPLFKSWESGEFEMITPLTRLMETRRLLKKLAVADCELASDHLTNYLWGTEGIIFQGVDGNLPGDKQEMLKTLDDVIKKIADRDDILDANALVQQGVIQRL